MPTATPRSLYFSGDGLLWAARAASDGTAMGYRAVGNVSSLVLSPTLGTVERRRFSAEHIALHDDIPLSIGGKLTANLESLDPANIAMLAGDYAVKRAATSGVVLVTKGGPGAYTPLSHVFITEVTSVLTGPTALTGFVDSDTPYDYRVDENGGLIYINDGVLVDIVGLRLAGTAAPVTAYGAVGRYLQLTTELPMEIGEAGMLMDPGGSLGALPLKFVVRSVDTGVINTNIPVAAAPALVGTPTVIGDSFPLTVTYTHGAQTIATGKAAKTNHWSFLFQGLNGVDGLLHNIRIPRAFIRAGFALDLLNSDLASMPLEAVMLHNPRDPDPQLYTIETTAQGFRPII